MITTTVRLNYTIWVYPTTSVQLNAIYDSVTNTFILVDENGNQLTTDDNTIITTDPE